MTPWVVDPSTVAPTYTDRGVPYKPLWKLVPWLQPYYTAYEKNYNAVSPALSHSHCLLLPGTVCISGDDQGGRSRGCPAVSHVPMCLRSPC
jgi:hypothetical protein